jgi:hypothetical protein
MLARTGTAIGAKADAAATIKKRRRADREDMTNIDQDAFD